MALLSCVPGSASSVRAYYSIHRFGSMVPGGRLNHISDLGVFARLIKTSGFEGPPSGKENMAEAANYVQS